MKYVKTFEQFVNEKYSATNESDIESKEDVEELLNAMADQFAKVDMALELMTEDEEQLKLGRAEAATELSKQIMTGLLQQDIPRDKLPGVKKVLLLFKNEFPDLAVKNGLEYAMREMITKLDSVLEFNYQPTASDISEDATVNKLAKIGQDDFEAGVAASIAYLKKELKNLF